MVVVVVVARMVMLMIRQCEAVLLGIVGDISQLQVLVEEGSVIFMFFVQDFFRQRAPRAILYTQHSALCSLFVLHSVALQEERSNHYIP